MKILSLNARGLGIKAKRSEIKRLVIKHNIEFCCIQETKIGRMENNICKALWKDFNFDWSSLDAEGRSDGI